MKSTLYFLSIFYTTYCYGQFVKAPNFEFGGTNIEWSHTITDPWEDNFPSYTYKNSEVGIITSPSIEVNNLILFKVHNWSNYVYGDILAAYDIKSGEEKWLRYLNPQNHNNIGTFYDMDMVTVDGNSVALRGVNSTRELPTVPLSSPLQKLGYFTNEIIDIKDGTTKNLTKITNESIVLVCQSTVPDGTGKEFVYLPTNRQIPPQFDTKICPMWIDYNAQKVYNTKAEDTTNQILYKIKNTTDNYYGPELFGPFRVSDNAFGFLTYTQNDKEGKYYYWISDKNTNILFRKDISTDINSLFKYDPSSSIRQIGDHIYIQLVTKDGTRFGNAGYVILDMYGNVVRKKVEMVLDGKKVERIITTPLKNDDELLHVINFQQSNDVFLYRESKNGTFVKAGQLENKNTKSFPYISKYVMQTSDEGIVITGSFLLDSTFCRLDCAGWPLIIKLSASTLGLPVSLPDMPDEPYTFTISPNPAQDRCVVSLSEDISVGTLIFTDLTGKRVHTVKVLGGQNEVDISHLPSGVYVCHTESEGGNKYTERKKLVIMR